MNKTLFFIMAAMIVAISAVSCVSGKKFKSSAGYKQTIHE